MNEKKLIEETRNFFGDNPHARQAPISWYAIKEAIRRGYALGKQVGQQPFEYGEEIEVADNERFIRSNIHPFMAYNPDAPFPYIVLDVDGDELLAFRFARRPEPQIEDPVCPFCNEAMKLENDLHKHLYRFTCCSSDHRVDSPWCTTKREAAAAANWRKK